VAIKRKTPLARNVRVTLDETGPCAKMFVVNHSDFLLMVLVWQKKEEEASN